MSPKRVTRYPLKPTIPQRIKELLSSNEPPTPEEIPEFSSLLSNGRSRVEQLGTRIEELTKELNSLITERSSIKGDLECYQEVMNPVRRIPEELLHYIFSIATPTDTEDSLNTKSPPWTLAQVSRHWRQSAVLYPLLWTNVAVHLASSRSDPSMEGISFLSGVQLHRSANQPLNVSISVQTLMGSNPILTSLISTAPRWRSLSLSMPLPQLPSLRHLEGFLQSLESLRVYAYPTRNPSHDAFNLPFFRFAPRLTRIEVLYPYPELLIIPTENITEFIAPVHSWGPEEHLVMLKKLSSVELCHIVCHFDIDGVATTAVDLPHLRELEVELDGRGLFLDFIRAPVLHRLAIKGTTPFDGETLLGTLEELELEDPALSDEQCVELLLHATQLRRLLIKGSGVSTVLLARLCDHKGSVIVPKLEYLEMHLCNSGLYELESLEAMRPKLQVVVHMR